MNKKSAPRYKNQTFLKQLGAHCKKLRVKNGYSIDRLSKEGEQLSPGAIQRLETGTADVHVSQLYRYAQVLNIRVSELLNFGPDEKKAKSYTILKSKPSPKSANFIPYYAIEIAAGLFDRDSNNYEPQGWVEVAKKGITKDYFAAHVYGSSMEPTIPEGSLCLFKRYTGGTRNGKVMLVQAKGLKDPEMGYKFVIKRYQRITPLKDSEDRSGMIVHLLSDNPKFAPLILKNTAEEDISTPALFLEVLE